MQLPFGQRNQMPGRTPGMRRASAVNPSATVVTKDRREAASRGTVNECTSAMAGISAATLPLLFIS
jgi:hypothetical protein